MTTQEFSDAFDTLLNSYSQEAMFGEGAAKQDISMDEYEKSVLLTQAQDIVVKSYFDADLNNAKEGFDDSTRRQIDFSSLLTVAACSKVESSNGSLIFNSRGILYSMPTDLLYILNEKIQDDVAGKVYVVVPISYKEYDRLNSKPYKQALKNQCWRLFQNNKEELVAEVIPNAGVIVSTYKIRYVRRPTPIITVDLSEDNLEIDGVTEVSECELNPIIHNEILQKAVELALSTRGGRVPSSQYQQQRQQPQQAQ